MLTPKAFTPPYGPNDTKVVWTLEGTRVERNGEIEFDLAAITDARIHRATMRGEHHRLDVIANGTTHAFTSSAEPTVDTDGWQWFVVTLLRRAQHAQPDLRVDVRRVRSDFWSLLVGILFLAIGMVAALFWLTSATNDQSDAAVVLRAMVLLGCLVGGAAMILRGSPRGDNRPLVTPDDAADLAVKYFKRRYRS